MPRPKNFQSKERSSPGSRIGRMTLTLTTAVVLMITLLIPSVENARQAFYTVGEEGARGSQTLALVTTAVTRSLCAGACTSANGCLGFNWMPGAARKCELLSSLRQVVSDLSCNIYVPDALVRTAVKLEYSCPNCMPSAPLAINTWPHRCDPNGVAVGIASATSFPDLDYLLCVQIPNMMVDMGNGYTCADDTRGCETITSASNLVIDCIWGDTQYYNPAGSLRYACRSMTTTMYKIDLTRCVRPKESFGYAGGISTPVRMFRCPPHMLAQRYFATAAVPAYLLCCLLY